MPRVLYVHHGNTRGGAAWSLLHLMEALRPAGFDCVVAAGDDDEGVPNFFGARGFEALPCRLRRFSHVTGGAPSPLALASWAWLPAWARDFRPACRRFEELLAAVRPELVHLNSLTLAPYARVPHRLGIPCVVHVRECVADGLLGVRAHWLRRQLVENAGRAICICRDSRDRLRLGDTFAPVIYNPVDPRKHDARLDRQAAREALGIAPEARAVLFAGGSVLVAKGLHLFLAAMALLREREPRLACLMPSFVPPAAPAERKWTARRRVAWMLGMFREGDGLYRRLQRSRLDGAIVSARFTHGIERWIAASDVVCVPHVQPHFSRTILEAGVMKRPVVASRIGGIEEVVEHEKTGLLVQPGDAPALARAVERLFSDQALAGRLGEGAYAQARELSDPQRCAAQVWDVYRELGVPGAARSARGGAVAAERPDL